MLSELHIENIAVIEKTDIEFGNGLNILTGETGAGKSIVMDSIGAVLGARVSRELIRNGADKGVVTAVFQTNIANEWLKENDIESEDELIIQRKVTSDGKSSCRVCGTPVSVSQLRELGSLLLDMHSQNDNRQLMDEANHRAYLDSFAELDDLLNEFQDSYLKYKQLISELSKFDMEESEKSRLSDLLKYEIDELESANLVLGEEQEKSERRDLLRNSEKLTEYIDEAYNGLYGDDYSALNAIDNAVNLISRAAEISSELSTTSNLLNDVSTNLYDAIEQIRDFRESLDFSPNEYDQLESRLAQLRKLERKYNTDEAGLINRLERNIQKLNDIEYSNDRILLLERDIELQAKQCVSIGQRITEKRKKAAITLSQRIVSELSYLNMPSVRFEVDITPINCEPPFDKYGCDNVRFVMSANAGENVGSISKIASGGELSRIMLALKNVFSQNENIPVMVFDEIDTGVSGRAAQKVGEKLSMLSYNKQVLCVTHLPQIAAFADNHFVIDKQEKNGKTYTTVTPLDFEGKKKEIARLQGGENITETTLKSAEEQLLEAERFKGDNYGKSK